MKRYVARALRERAAEMGVSPRALKRRIEAQPADVRAQYRKAKLRRLQQAAPSSLPAAWEDPPGGAQGPTERS